MLSLLLVAGVVGGLWLLLSPDTSSRNTAGVEREANPLPRPESSLEAPSPAPTPEDNGLGFVTVAPENSPAGPEPSVDSSDMSPSSSMSPSPSDAIVVNPSPSPTVMPTVPSDPLSLDEAAADSALRDLRLAGLPSVTVLTQDRWYPQLSSKCSALKEGDFGGGTGVSLPTGQERAYPNGIGSNRILALDAAYRLKFGRDVITVLHQDVRPGAPKNPDCGSSDMWITMYVGESFSRSRDALAWCRQERLPNNECGARWIGPSGKRTIY